MTRLIIPCLGYGNTWRQAIPVRRGPADFPGSVQIQGDYQIILDRIVILMIPPPQMSVHSFLTGVEP
jgi:hypothetical protein